MEKEKGLKYDQGKQEWFAMPLCVLEDLADVFNAGEKKYKIFNCLNSFDNPERRFYNAAMRHLTAAQIDPLAKDEETGCYHLAQVAFSVLMRLYHCKQAAQKPANKKEAVNTIIENATKSSGAKIIKSDFQVFKNE